MSKFDKDTLGTRMKENYENRSKFFLPRRSYIILRVDGKAFHTYTKGLIRPFDSGLIEDMDEAAAYLCKNIMGAQFAYVQSDEISILLTDFGSIETQAWFDNNIQKLASVSASMATSAFNKARISRFMATATSVPIEESVDALAWAEFDSRAFQIPQRVEVENYFIWRQQDATRNSISSAAQSVYPHKELEGKSGEQKQEMLFQKGINWNDYDPKCKRGRVILPEEYIATSLAGDAVRTRWVSVAPPIFTQERDFLAGWIPESR